MNRTDDELTREQAAQLHEQLSRRALSKRRAGHAKRAAGLIVSLLVAVAAIAWSIGRLSPLGDPTSSPSPGNTVNDDSNYSIAFLGLADSSSGSNAAIRLRVTWSGDSYPGKRECRIKALDGQGDVVGAGDFQFSLVPNTSETPTVDFNVSGPVTDATGSCGPRLDVGDPYEYALTHVTALSKPDGVTVYASAKWQGQGQPGVVHCRVAAVDVSGQVVASTDSLQGDTPSEEQYWDVRIDSSLFDGSVTDGKLFGVIRCVPYVDGQEQLPPIGAQDLQPSLDYPYQSPPGGGYTFSNVVFRQAPDGWVVDYQATWETDAFPGERRCSAEVFDQGGNVIGQESGPLEALQQGIYDREIHTSREPISFEASCGDRLDTPVTYVITDPAPVPDGSKVAISYHVAWPDLPAGEHPGTDQCLAAFVAGSVIAVEPFTLDVPPGTYTERGEFDPASVAGATPIVRCEPYEGTDAMAAMVDSFKNEIEGTQG